MTTPQTTARDVAFRRDLELAIAYGHAALGAARLAEKDFMLAAFAAGACPLPAPALLADRDVAAAAVAAGHAVPAAWLGDRDIVLAALATRHAVDFADLPRKLRDDPVVAAAYVRAQEISYDDLPQKLRQNRDVVVALAAVAPDFFLEDPKLVKRFGADRDVVLACLSLGSSYAAQLDLSALWHDEEVLACIVPSQFALVPADVRARREVAVLAVSLNGENLALLDARLSADRVFASEVLARSPFALGAFADSIRDDEALALDAVTRAPATFGAASARLRDDASFVLRAVRFGASIEHASERLRDDPEIARAFVERAGSLALVSPAQRANRDVVTAALQADGANLAHVDASLLAGPAARALVELALSNDASAAVHAPAQLLADKATALAWIARFGGAVFAALPAALKKDPDVVRATVADVWEPLVLTTLGVDLRDVPLDAAHAHIARIGACYWHYLQAGVVDATDKQLAIAAVSAFPSVYSDLPGAIVDDVDVAVAQWTRWPDHRHRIRDAIREDPAFMLALARADVHALDVDAAMRERVFGLDPSLRALWEQSRASLDAVGIYNALRLSPAARAEIVANRATPRTSDDQRPTALVVTPRADANGAFAFPNYEALTKHYRVLYFEAASDADLRAVLDDVKARGESAELVVLAGHGRRDLLAFGAADPASLPGGASPALERYVDFGDADLLAGALRDVTRPGASLVVASCSTGEGRDRAGNIANLVASWVPHAHVVAPTITSNLRFVLDAHGRFERAAFYTGDGHVYAVPARA